MLLTARTLSADIARGAVNPLSVFCVGTDGTATSSGQTKLLAEAARVLLPAAGTDTSTQKNLRSGLSVTLWSSFTGLDGTFREGGLAGGIASPPGDADSGVFWNRFLFGPTSLTAPETLTLRSVLTFG
jgi:hypothetical protein